MVARTKKDILNAYNELIKTVNMDHITVEMLADAAEVSRATFYRYFKDKYDVMNYNYKMLLDNMASPTKCHSYIELYENLYKHGKKNWRFLQNAFNTDGVNSFCNYIAEHSKELVEQITVQNRNGNGFTAAENLQLDVFIIGIGIMYKNWIFDKYNLTPAQAAQALYEVMPETLRDMWWID